MYINLSLKRVGLRGVIVLDGSPDALCYTTPAPTAPPIDLRLCPGPVRLLAGTLHDDISFSTRLLLIVVGAAVQLDASGSRPVPPRPKDKPFQFSQSVSQSVVRFTTPAAGCHATLGRSRLPPRTPLCCKMPAPTLPEPRPAQPWPGGVVEFGPPRQHLLFKSTISRGNGGGPGGLLFPLSRPWPGAVVVQPLWAGACLPI